MTNCGVCEHALHVGRCGAPLTNTIRDDVGYGGVRPTFKTVTLRVGECECGDTDRMTDRMTGPVGWIVSS